jgi:hypothetical protein
VGKIAVDYMLKHLKGEKFAEIISDSFPPSVHTKKSIIELIKDDFFHVRHNNQDFVFLAGPVQPALDVNLGGASEHYEFAGKVVQTAKEINVTQIYTLAGINIGEKRMTVEPGIVVASSSERLLKELIASGAKPSQDEGLISGAAGLILGLAKEEGIEGACIMGETNARLIYGDHASAKKIIELLIKRHGFKIDMSQIEKDAIEIERAFTQLSKQLEEQEDSSDNGLSYVR